MNLMTFDSQEVTQMLVKDPRVDLNIKDIDGQTAAMIAISYDSDKFEIISQVEGVDWRIPDSSKSWIFLRTFGRDSQTQTPTQTPAQIQTQTQTQLRLKLKPKLRLKPLL